MGIINENFMLYSNTAKQLYYDYAENLPIIDYHCHLVPEMIANDHKFADAYELFLGGDHYKWRQMRSNGVPENMITGDADNFDKWMEFAKTLPYLIGNPIYHWTALELKRYFDIDEVLCEDNAKDIWDRCNALLAKDDFSGKSLITKSNVEVICTTDDPADNLEHHIRLREDGFGTKILPTDEVRFNDERLQGEKHVYIVLNKPKGYVTSLDDPHAEKTVMDLVKGACTERVYPVGRLDKNSLGLLLITNDGDITRQLTHPSNRKKKIYQVTLDKPLTRADMDTLTEGITLEDGDIFADEIAYASEDKKCVGVEIHSGRNRIVRRMFEHLGYTVQKLDRVYYAGLTKKNLKRGAWRFLTREEVMRLKTGQYE